MGALQGPPYVLPGGELNEAALAAAGDDAYSRQLHVVARRRAVAQITQ